MKIKITFDKESCIGAAACEALSPDFWQVSGGKSILRMAKLNSKGQYELILDGKDWDLQKDVALRCPSNSIKVEKIE